MNRNKTFLILLVALALFGSACKRSAKVGSKELTELEEQQQKRLGEIIQSPQGAAGQSPAVIGASPPPQQNQNNQQQQQQPQQEFIDLELLDTAPYYFAAGEPSCSRDSAECLVSAAAGTIIRIVNKDDQPRRYQSGDGTYDTGDIPPGGTKQVQVAAKGEFQIVDPHLPFATSTLQVF